MIPTDEQRLEIGELVGLAFCTGARGPASFDCLGLTMRGLEILRPDLALVDPWENLGGKWESGWRPEPGEYFPGGWSLASLTSLELGDVLLVGHTRGEAPTLEHLDLVLWGGLMLRTRRKTGVTIEPARRLLAARGHGGEGILGAMRPPIPMRSATP